MSDKAKKRTKEDEAKKLLKEERIVIDLELAIKKEKFKKTITNERKCDECDENGFQEYEGKFRCKKHHTEANGKPILNLKKGKLSKNML